MGFKEKNIIFKKDANNADFQMIFGNAGDHKGTLNNLIKKDISDVFIYYSGHGAPDVNTKNPYLVPVNANPNSLALTGYSMDIFYKNLLKLVKDKNPKSMTIVIDACFSGLSNGTPIIQNASGMFIEVDMPVFRSKNTVLFTSSRKDQVSSWYHEKKHGLFTYFFLKALKDGIENQEKITAGYIENAISSNIKGVEYFARRLYGRDQKPMVVGEKNITLIP